MNSSERNNPELNKNLDMDPNLLKRIIEIQDLPEEVVLSFIKAAGSLSSTNFGKIDLDESN